MWYFPFLVFLDIQGTSSRAALHFFNGLLVVGSGEMGTSEVATVAAGEGGVVSPTSVLSPKSNSVRLEEISPLMGIISLLTKGLPGLKELEKEEEVMSVPRWGTDESLGRRCLNLDDLQYNFNK